MHRHRIGFSHLQNNHRTSGRKNLRDLRTGERNYLHLYPARQDTQDEDKEKTENGPEENKTAAGEQSVGSESTENVQASPQETVSLKTVLIAEDTDSNYILTKAILGKEYHLERAKDGMEAVNMFVEINPDIILMDMKMPNLDGLDATKIIRELSPGVPIIALTAFAYDHDRKAHSKRVATIS